MLKQAEKSNTTDVQSVVTRMFTRSGRQTQIEGLYHRGVSFHLRHNLTDFGSGWQGILREWLSPASMRGYRLATHVSPVGGLSVIRPNRLAKLASLPTKSGSEVMGLENLFEMVRRSTNPHQPSRLKSAFFGPKLSRSVDVGEHLYIGRIPKYSVIRNQEYYTEAAIYPEDAHYWAKKYWKNYDFGTLKRNSKRSQEFFEFLVPHEVTVFALPTKYHEPLIEGLKHGNLSSQLRRILTDFGSGWTGLPPKSPFSLRPYARALRKGIGGFNPLRKRDSLELAKDVHPFMKTMEVRYINQGNESLVYSLGSEHILKLSTPAQIRFNVEGKEHTPLPMEKLKNVEGILQPEYHRKFSTQSVDFLSKDVEASVFPRAQVTDTYGKFAVSKSQVNEMKDKLAKQGIFWTDEAPRNMGLLKGKPVVIDTGYMFGADVQARQQRWRQLLNSQSKLASEAKAIMKTGEGTAIAKAGTGRVAAVLKAGARLIKNSL